MKSEDRLALYDIAERLERYVLDNGPMGETRPFADEARQLRRIAQNNNVSTGGGDWRDVRCAEGQYR